MRANRAVLLAVVSPAIIAALRTSTRILQSSGASVAMAAVYIALTSSFAITAAGILTTVAVYLSTVCVLYLVLAKQKWWTIVRLDALCGAALLFVFDIAWFAKTVSDSLNGNEDGISLAWLIVLVDITVCLVSAGVVGVAIYVAPKVKRRTDLAVGNVSVFSANSMSNGRPLTDGCSCRASCYPHPSSGCSVAPLSCRST